MGCWVLFLAPHEVQGQAQQQREAEGQAKHDGIPAGIGIDIHPRGALRGREGSHPKGAQPRPGKGGADQDRHGHRDAHPKKFSANPVHFLQGPFFTV